MRELRCLVYRDDGLVACDALDEAFLPFVREVLEGALLGLRDEERREDTRKHEEREDLKTEKEM